MSPRAETAGRLDGTTGGGLPRGPHELSAQQVENHQRARLLAAVPKALATHGYAPLAVEHLVAEAGVSRSTFYANFSDKRDCVYEAQGRAFERLSALVFRVCVTQGDWPAKIAASIRVVVAFASEAPEQARLLLLDSVGSDPVLSAQARAATEHFVRLLQAGRDQSEVAASLPELTEQALVGSVTSVVGRRLMLGRPELLPAVAPDLIQLMLIPYVGPAEARRLAAAPA